MHKTLINSSMIAAVASVSFISGADAAVTHTHDTGVFAAANAGLTTVISEDFTGLGYLTYPTTSWTSGDLSVSGSVLSNAAYFSGASEGIGESDAYGGPLTLAFANGVQNLEFEFMEVFLNFGFAPSDFTWNAYDMGGALIGSGSVANAKNTWNGIMSDSGLIGSLVIDGTGFGMNAPEYVDNVVGYAVPAPGALALLGLAGLTSRRRRK